VNKCVFYQMSFMRESARFPWANGYSRWLPTDPRDTNPYGIADSMSMNVGSLEYTVRARAVDEYGRPDGTPAEAPVVGNHAPTLDSFGIRNHDGTVIQDDDTLVWDWWDPVDSTFTVESVSYHMSKTFFFDIQATGHDHHKDPDGSGITTWYHSFRRADDPFYEQKFGRSGFWWEGDVLNQMSDRFEFTFAWSSPIVDSLGNLLEPDFAGEAVFADLPPWINRSYDLCL